MERTEPKSVGRKIDKSFKLGTRWSNMTCTKEMRCPILQLHIPVASCALIPHVALKLGFIDKGKQPAKS